MSFRFLLCVLWICFSMFFLWKVNLQYGHFAFFKPVVLLFWAAETAEEDTTVEAWGEGAGEVVAVLTVMGFWLDVWTAAGVEGLSCVFVQDFRCRSIADFLMIVLPQRGQ